MRTASPMRFPDPGIPWRRIRQIEYGISGAAVWSGQLSSGIGGFNGSHRDRHHSLPRRLQRVPKPEPSLDPIAGITVNEYSTSAARQRRALEMLGSYQVKAAGGIMIADQRRNLGGWIYASHLSLLFRANEPLRTLSARFPGLVDAQTVLLGVKESASAAEIRKAHLTRSRPLDPDRFSGLPAEDIHAATAAMSQINAAYEILSNEDANQATDPVALIVQCGTCGQRNRVSTPGRAVCSICEEDLRPKQQVRGAEHADSGFPRWGHGESSCAICGWGPARPVKFNSVTGWIIFLRWITFEAACDDPSASWIAYAEEPRQADQTTLCSVGPGRYALTINEWDLFIARTALTLYMAVLAGDKGELHEFTTGPESDDDGTAGALMLFWAIDREVPSVRARLGEAAAATDPKYQRSFTTSLMVIGTILSIIANDPEGSEALEEAISVVLN